MPDASFAGQQETFLNVRGINAVLEKVKEVFASLFIDRAIAYRVHHGFDHAEVALSVGIQQMVKSSASSVASTLDTESGFKGAVFITSSWGLGELIVQGAVNPDEFYVHKASLRAGCPAILSRKLGTKLEKMVFSTDSSKLVDTLNTNATERQSFSLADNDFERSSLSDLLLKHKAKLFGLIIEPNRLMQIRQARKSNSRYASLEQCMLEVRQTERLYRYTRIPFFNVTSASVEEIASTILQRKNLAKRIH